MSAASTKIQSLTEEQLTTLSKTTNETEWNAAASSIKAANGGEYPSDWYARVLKTGFLYNMTVKWASAAGKKTQCPGCSGSYVCTFPAKSGRMICESCRIFGFADFC